MEGYWRNYLGNANVDIFEFIKKAIMVAANNYPSEFQNNKDKISETLYSCALIKFSGCDKYNKRTSNMSSKKTQEERMQNKLQDDIQKESIPKASETCQPKAKSLTTSIVYCQGVAEVLRIKGILEEAGESESIICDLLDKLQYMGLTLNTLEVTGIGKTVKVLRNHASKNVSQIAKTLVKEWKDMVEEWFKKEASVVHPNSEEQVKQTSLTTEYKFQIDSDKENKAKGKLTTDQQSKDMYSKEVLIQHKLEAIKRKPPMEKENRTTLQQVNNQTMDVVKKVFPVLKPVNLVAKTQLGISSQSSNNTKGLVIPHQQCKPMDSGMAERNRKSESSIEETIEATKRKLQQGYTDAENMKKKRIQVMELHELPKQVLYPQLGQHMKPQNRPLRRSGNAHSCIGQLVSTY